VDLELSKSGTGVPPVPLLIFSKASGRRSHFDLSSQTVNFSVQQY
jgi:hypothetical protein